MISRARRIGRRVGLAAALSLPLVLLLGTGAVSAHAILVRTDPVDGVTLPGAPDQIRVVFSQPVVADLTLVTLTDGSDRPVAGTAVAADPTSRSAILVRLPVLVPDAYRLDWRTVDESDLHVTSGSLVFGLGRPAPPAPVAVAVAPGPAEVLIRWIDLLAVALLTGSLLLLAVLLPRARRPDIPSESVTGGRIALARTLLLVATGSAVGAVVTGGAQLVLWTGQAGAAFPLRAVIATDFGISWLIREAVLLALLVLAGAGLRSLGRTPAAPAGRLGPRPAAVGVALLGLAGVTALSGHAASGLDAERPLRVVALTLHLVAAWAWVGGLAVLVVAVLPRLLRRAEEADLARSMLRGFWRIAAPSLAVMAVTGLYLGGQMVASVDALIGTLYGQALIVKVGLALAAALLGLRNAARLHPLLATRLGPVAAVLHVRPVRPGRLPGAVVVESVGALAVVLAASLMAASPPARGPAFDPIPSVARQPDVASPLGDLYVTVSLRPGRPGPNFLDMGVFETRRPAPAPIGQVTVRLVSPDGQSGPDLVARPLGNSRYALADGSITIPGSWHIAVSVNRPGLPVSRLDVPWAVLPTVATDRHLVVSDQPLSPLASAAALLLALLFAAIVILAALRRHMPLPGMGSAPSSPVDAIGRGGSQS
jgi:copper transport protein